MRMRIAAIGGAWWGCFSIGARAPERSSLQPIGSFNNPIYMTSPPGDPRLFVVERGGTIEVVHDGGAEPVPGHPRR